MISLTILKILMNPSFQVSNISISTAHNITLKRDVSQKKKHHVYIMIQTMNPCMTSWIHRTPYQKMKKMRLVPLDTINHAQVKAESEVP
jgi:hypothetical protein